MLTMRRRDFLQWTGGAGATALLAACGRDPGAPAANGAPLSLQSPWVNDAEFIGYFVAIAKGWYANEGLAFDYKKGAPEIIADEVLARRRCDVALTNPDGTFQAILNQGAPFKIIGTQYHKSPLGIVSLKENNITAPKDLIGKRLAVPDANRLTAKAFLELNKINPQEVEFVTYAYDPKILINGTADATIDFVTNVPYTIRLKRREPTSFLLADHGFPMFMDTVVVRAETLQDAAKRKHLVAFLRASRRGWVENFKNVDAYPERFMPSFFKDTGRTVDNEKYFNLQQKPLIENPAGIFAMSEEGIASTIESLNRVGFKASRDVFVTDLLSEV